jgi:death on curing protein
VERVELADLLVIAEIHTGMAELHPTFAKKAAVHASRLVRYHPLPDGNKRTAYDVMRESIERNGFAFVHPPGGLMETAEMIEKLAADAVTEDEFAAWLAQRITRP